MKSFTEILSQRTVRFQYVDCLPLKCSSKTCIQVLFANRSTLHVKISDFGLANVEQRDQLFGSQCGTPNYGKSFCLIKRMR